MITSTSTKEGDLPSRQEGNSSDHHGKVTNRASSSSSTPWLRLKDPRIVRVSRAFGGKDRHSKVSTIRGLRDRRVRLSVPTAIQLYDLQDRLGLNQPSKVVDWLLNAAKHEIDELPPLPMPPGNFGLNHHSAGDHTQSNEEEGFKNIVGWDGGSSRLLARSNFWSSDALWRARSKEVARETATDDDDRKDKQQGNDSNNILPRSNTNHHPAAAFLPGLLNNVTPYGYHHWEPPSNYLGSHGLMTSQADHHHLHNLNVVSVPSTLSLSTGTQTSQFLVCPQPGITQPYFPSNGVASGEIDHARQVNHFQMLSSATTSSSTTSQNLLPISPLYPSCQSMRPFHSSMNSKLDHSPNDIAGSQPNKAREFSSK